MRGWVKIYSFTQPVENIFRYTPWHLRRVKQGEEVIDELVVTDSRCEGKRLLARFAGIEDRDLAAELAGAEIFVERRQFADTAQGEHYWSDLVGLPVETADGRLLGKVDSLLETGANDVLVIDGEKRCLVPFVAGQVVKTVDLDAGRIVVDWDPDF